MHRTKKSSWWARMGRWWSRRWRVRRQRGNDFAEMGTAFGLDAVTEQSPLAEPGSPGVDSASGVHDRIHDRERDRANRRSVW